MIQTYLALWTVSVKNIPRGVVKLPRSRRRLLAGSLAGTVLLAGAGGLLGVCGPFTDVTADSFCPFVLEIFYLGITSGTSPTTYSPGNDVTRKEMAVFLSRGVDSVLRRGSRRAALRQFWTTKAPSNWVQTPLGNNPIQVRSDGADLWVSDFMSGTVSRVRASDGRMLETWTGANHANGVLVAMGAVFVTGEQGAGNLYLIDPTKPAGAVGTVVSNLGSAPEAIAYDGRWIWTANAGGSVTRVTPWGVVPWTVTTVNSGFDSPRGIVFDGANVWVTDYTAGTLLKLDSTGAVLQTVTTDSNPALPVFDGSNIWVPNHADDSVSVVRASSGAVLATLTGNGLWAPVEAAFDGQRVLVTNFYGNSVSLWKAADLTPMGFSKTFDYSLPTSACSDGIDFWVILSSGLARF